MKTGALPSAEVRLGQYSDQGWLTHGAQLFVSVEGHVVADIAIGEARPGVPMIPRTISRQYCATAPLTAVALAQLVAQRRIGIDQPIRHFVPEFAPYGKDRITLRHVLTHTAGLHTFDSEGLGHDSEASLEALCRAQLPAGWVPGARAAYSEVAGWRILGEVIERVVTSSLGSYLRKEVFAPLGLKYCWVGMSEEEWREVRGDLGVLYWHPAEGSCDAWLGLDLVPMWHDLTKDACSVAVPSAGYAAARTLGYLYVALLDSERFEECVGVPANVLREFTGVQRSGMYDATLGRVCDYGLGFMVNMTGHGAGSRCSRGSFGHAGLQGASLAFCDPRNGLALALFFNDVLDTSSCQSRRLGIVDAVYEDLGFSGPRSASRERSGENSPVRPHDEPRAARG